jgi:chemotaxis family two-component system sensor kinase Cph1
MTQASPADDFSRCDQEPIRFPGSIQPHGFLLALDPAQRGWPVRQVSDNLAAHTGMAAADALGQPLAAVIGAALCAQLAPSLATGQLRERPAFLASATLPGARRYDVLAHAFDGLLLLEFEASGAAGDGRPRQLYPLVGDFLQKGDDADTIEDLSALAAAEIRALTGYDRVLVYRFDAEGHGHVLAERRTDGIASYLGQRFPASDIPRQARALYERNRIRLIRDASYAPARLVPELNPQTGAPLDLAFATLRSVSAVHLHYMRNMGTLASMSISLMVQGRLWGMISCHHLQPRALPFDQRTVCEQLGQILALRIATREDADEMAFRLERRRILVQLLGGLTKGADFLDNVDDVYPDLLQFARAGGVAFVVDQRVLRFGATPDETQLQALAGWLNQNAPGDVYHTDRLADAYPPAAELQDCAAGLLALRISRIHPHYLLWFRHEVVRDISWAGDPHAKQGATLTPRNSFDSWRETIHGSSLPWHGGELELALEFRGALLGMVLERAEQMAELAEELGRANKELEAFSYSVSHDLRAPLRHIVGFSDLLLDASLGDNPEKRLRFLHNIKESARLAGKLVDDLLSFSQMGRAALHPVEVSMVDMVRSCIERLASDAAGRAIDWHIDALPRVVVDPTFLHLALANLLANAIKFTAQRELAVIRVSADIDSARGETVFHVADNGVGFNMDYVHKLFGVFQRLHRMEDFPGTGIGLANVRRIVERHGGRVWADAPAGQGATFSFAIPHQLPPVPAAPPTSST